MPGGADVGENLARAENYISKCASQGAEIICTQELFTTSYFCQTEDIANFDLAESIPGPTSEALCRLARQLKRVIIASLFERRMPGLYHNTAIVIGNDGNLLGLYRKMHIPHDPAYYEKFYFTPGDIGYSVWKTPYADIAVLICWDQWFPEAARLAALQGAQILFYPTAIGWHEDDPSSHAAADREAWEIIQRSHSIANGIYVCSVNRVGREGKLNFWGGSFVSDPMGQVLSRAGQEEGILTVEIDLQVIERRRREWPFLRDRRIESYHLLSKRGV